MWTCGGSSFTSCLLPLAKEKNMNAVLTDLGEKVAQDLLGVDNLWEPEEGVF